MTNTTAILNRVHSLLEKDSSYPTSTEEDYIVRIELLRDAVGIWEFDNENGTLWKELLVSLSDVDTNVDTTVDVVTANGEDTYNCPEDFVFPVSFVKVGTGATAVYYKRIRADEKTAYEGTDNEEDVYYVIGNKKVGYKIKLMGTIPTEILPIEYDYYKQASLPTVGSDILEMTDDQFGVYWVLAELTKDDDPGLSSTYSQIALNKLDAMRLRNEQTAAFQFNEVIDTNSGF